MKTTLIKIAISTATVLLISACGSSSSDDAATALAKSVSGIVSDPAISGASVSIVCGAQTYTADSTTDSDGKFTISNIPASTDLSLCTLEAAGGVDGADDLTGLTLKSPYKMFNKQTGLIISPFTNAVAEHDSGDINTSIDAVAQFFSVNAEDLKKDPAQTLRLAKITKKMTKIALRRAKNGDIIGYLDIDKPGLSASNLDDYVDNDLDLHDDEQDALDEELELVNNAASVDEIIKSGIVANTITKLKKAYKQENYSDEEKANFKYLALKLTDMLSKVEDGKTKYTRVNRFHLRKALTDLDMIPSFENNNSLESNLALTLSKSDTDFIDYVDNNRTVDIADVDGLILFDSSTYESIVGNDNAKRIGYYTYSDKSNIAKILKVSKDSYTDDVLDVVNSKLSNGLAKLGFKDEAFENLQKNVYTPEIKEQAYKSLASHFLELGDNARAADAQYKRYETLALQINAVGLDNASSLQLASVGKVAERLSLLEDSNRTNTAIEYLESLAVVTESGSVYARVPAVLSEMARNVYLQTKELTKAKEFTLKAVKKIKSMPRDSQKASVYNTLRIALSAALFGENEKAKGLAIIAKDLDDGETYTGYKKTYSYYPVAVEAVVGEVDINTTITNFNALYKSKQDDAAKFGYSAALMLNGRADELFNNVYKNRDIYKLTSQDSIFKNETNLGAGSTFQTADILKMRADKTVIIDWLDRLYDMSKEYNASALGSDRDIQRVFAQWDKRDTYKYGYLAMAKMYRDLDEEQKAQNLITVAIAKVNALTDIKYTLYGNYNILNARTEIGLDSDTAVTTDLIEKIKAAALHIEFDDSEDILNIANLLSSRGGQSDAIALVEKVYGLLDTQVDGDLGTVSDRVEILLGEKSTKGIVSENIVTAYLQAGDVTEAKKMVALSYTDIMTLADTVDRDALLVNVVRAYASLNDYEALKPILESIKTPSELNSAKIDAAFGFANYDAFSMTNAASVDSDNDGKPDFWNISATQEEIDDSGLSLDEDIDNDGISDDEDTLPYDNIN